MAMFPTLLIPRSRGRSCSAPPPSHGGPECGGESTQQQQCRPAAECHAPGPSVQVSRGDIVPVFSIQGESKKSGISKPWP